MSDSRFRAVKAYQNEAFLGSRDARPLRLLAEYLEPESRLEELRVRDTVVVFGSARLLPRDVAERNLEEAEAQGGDVGKATRDLKMSRFYEDTRQLCHRITEWSKELEGTDRRFVICSGGGPGIMEAANRGASEARGENIGLNISLPFEQNDNPYITRRLSFEFHYFFMRKFWFSYLAKAFIIMPGGFGTLDEFMEILTLVQTHKFKKPLAICLYGKEFWDDVLNLDALVKWGTISADDLNLFHRADDVDDAFDYVTGFLKQYTNERPQPPSTTTG